jgi:PleD family two-component response regulator
MGIVGFYPGDSEFVYRHGERLEPRKGLQIVIMEAQREEREDLGRCLEEQGHYVVAFPDENSALFYLEKHRVDVIVWGWDYNKKKMSQTKNVHLNQMLILSA